TRAAEISQAVNDRGAADSARRRDHAGFFRLSRAASFDARADQGWIAVSSRREAWRSGGAGDVDELEMRADGVAVRRREGRHCVRSVEVNADRIGASHA